MPLHVMSTTTLSDLTDPSNGIGTLSSTVVESFYLPVKYLREVTPYFRKASIVAEIGWDIQQGFLSRDVSHNAANKSLR